MFLDRMFLTEIDSQDNKEGEGRCRRKRYFRARLGELLVGLGRGLALVASSSISYCK